MVLGVATMNVRVGSEMTSAVGAASSRVVGELSAVNLRVLRVALAAQIALGLLWGVSMLFFARQIALGDPSGPHIEKIALEGGAHFTLVLGAILVWRNPRQAASALVLMVFLNALWAVTDMIYIPLFQLTAL